MSYLLAVESVDLSRVVKSYLYSTVVPDAFPTHLFYDFTLSNGFLIQTLLKLNVIL